MPTRTTRCCRCSAPSPPNRSTGPSGPTTTTRPSPSNRSTPVPARVKSRGQECLDHGTAGNVGQKLVATRPSVRGFVLLAHFLRDPAPRGNIETLGLRPLPNGPGVTAAAAPAGATGADDLSSVPDVDSHDLAQLCGVLLVEVDLVGGAVESERDGFIGLATVQVVLQQGDHLLSHCVPFRLYARG